MTGETIRQTLLALLAPTENRCHFCQRAIGGQEGLCCPRCYEALEAGLLAPRQIVEERPAPLCGCASAFAYQGLPARGIRLLKFSHDTALAELFAQALCRQLLHTEVPRGAWDALVPVPLHISRLRERGYNQSALLGRALAQSLSLPLRENWLFRVRATKPQSTQSRKERLAAMEGAFEACDEVAGLRILLVDDVLTTGATAQSLARLLRQAGARQVDVYCLARTPRPDAPP